MKRLGNTSFVDHSLLYPAKNYSFVETHTLILPCFLLVLITNNSCTNLVARVIKSVVSYDKIISLDNI